MQQHAAGIEVIEGGTVFIRQPERAVRIHGDALEVATTAIQREHAAAKVDGDLVVVRCTGAAAWHRHVGKPGKRASVVVAQQDLLPQSQPTAGGIEREAHQTRRECRQQERPQTCSIRLPIGAAIRVGDELQLAVIGDALIGKAREAAQFQFLSRRRRADCGHVLRRPFERRRDSGTTGIVLVAQRQQVEDAAALDVDLRDRIVLLQRHPRQARVVGHRDVLGLEVLGCRSARSVDADAAGTQGCFLSVVAREIHGTHGRGAMPASTLPLRQPDDADRSFRIHLSRAVGAGFALVGHQQMAPVRREGDHVRQRSHGHGPEQCSIGTIETDLAGRGLDGVLDGHRDEAAMGRHAVR